jgi:hypothetical protein
LDNILWDHDDGYAGRMGKINAYSPIKPLHEDVFLELEVFLKQVTLYGVFHLHGEGV